MLGELGQRGAALAICAAMAASGLVAFQAGSAAAEADNPPALHRLHLEVRIYGSGPYRGKILSPSGQTIDLAFQPGAGGVAVATTDFDLTPADDGRDQRALTIQRSGAGVTEVSLPLAVVTYAAPTAVSFDVQDFGGGGCRPRPEQGAGEAYWTNRFVAAQATYQSCLQQGATSQNTLDAMDYEIDAYNRLSDLDPTLFGGNDELVRNAQALIDNSDLCTGRPAIECSNLKQEIIWSNVADYKRLIVAQKVEAHLDHLSDAELQTALVDISAAKDAFLRCKSGDLAGKCGSLHTREVDYILTLKRFCGAAAGRGVGDLEDLYKCPKF